MSRPPHRKSHRGALLLLATCLGTVTLAWSKPPSLDLSFDSSGASLHYSGAFVSVAFEIGQLCSNSNRCLR